MSEVEDEMDEALINSFPTDACPKFVNAQKEGNKIHQNKLAEIAKTQNIFAVKLIGFDKSEKSIDLTIPHPPVSVFFIRNRNRAFIFSLILMTESGPVFIYDETPCLAFDAHENENKEGEEK